ncbi:hypothetical protein TWF694_011111 [Orbilia ellipsospora]|uniref:Cytochrome P450 n=1 Tax=Orbilia ellipsospora TaxID=2528407 RepID=A0AAV9X832_9PEZI
MLKFDSNFFHLTNDQIAASAGVATVGYFVLSCIYQLYFSPLSKIPGPWYTSVSRIWLATVTLTGKKVFALHTLHQKYGPFVRISPVEVAVADPETVKKIHSPADPFAKTEWYKRLGAGIHAAFLITGNEEHKQRRRAYGNAWSNSNLIKLEPVIRRHIDTATMKIKRDLERGRVVDVMKWFHFATVDTISEISFGKDFEMLKNESADHPFLADLINIQAIGGMRSEISGFEYIQAVLQWIPLPPLRRFFGCQKSLFEYSDRALSELKREVMNCKNGETRPTLFTQIIDNINNPDAKYRMTLEEMRHEAVLNLIAGTDNVTYTASWTIWVLYKHPEMRRKLEQELKPLNGDHRDDKLQKLPYLALVIKEILRLYNALAFPTPRVVPKGGRLLGPYFFPGGSEVTPTPYTLHRSPQAFEDPLIFNPDRWLNPTKEMEAAMIPWGGPTRSCIGQHLAMIQMRLFVANMITMCPNAVLAPTCTDESMEAENFFNLRPKGHKFEVQNKRK